MSSIRQETAVGQILTERPSRSRVFEKYNIDYCCGGHESLEEACAKRELDVAKILHELELSDVENMGRQETDWSKATISELVDHIVATHHEYLGREMPRLTALVNKVAEVHGRQHPELFGLQGVFMGFNAEIEAHKRKEEEILFPFSKELDGAESLPSFHCGSLRNPIRMMMYEHENAGAALGKMRELTNDFTMPADGCNTYRAMLDGLEQLETDMHWHIHKENNILFPTLIATEDALAANQ